MLNGWDVDVVVVDCVIVDVVVAVVDCVVVVFDDVVVAFVASFIRSFQKCAFGCGAQFQRVIMYSNTKAQSKKFE